MRNLNNKGYLPLQFLLILGLASAITAKATVETAKNGVLKKNGQKIWCKVQNKGKDYCDSLHK